MSHSHDSLPATGDELHSVAPAAAPTAAPVAVPVAASSAPASQPDPGLALVLGGGGAAGNAWLIGVIAGLADGGLDLTEAADQVIGTSAGATAAAQIRSGVPAADLLAAVLSPPTRPAGPHAGRPQAGPNREHSPALPMATVFQRMRGIGAASTSAQEVQQAMGAFALESDALLEPGAAQRRAIVAARLPNPEWPDRPMIVVAVDAHSGEVATFDRDSGVDLADAVTASTAAPGVVATVAIGGRRYMDGGIRSVENADLAAGFATVLVLSPLGDLSHTPPKPGEEPPAQFEGLRRFPGADLPSQVELLRAQGSRVEVITPDVDSRVAMGTNQMDPATRIPSARAGFTQGLQEAARLRSLRR